MIVSEFKSKCISVLKEMHKNHEPLVVTWRGKPLARVQPFGGPQEKRRLGALKGRMVLKADIERIGFDADWEMLA